MTQYEYNIEGMSCKSCTERISTALNNAGYKNVEVTLNPQKINFDSDIIVTEAEVQNLLSKAGNYKISKQHSHSAAVENHQEDEKLTPLFVILAYICGGVLLKAYLMKDFSLSSLMTTFMGGFLVIFSMFKFLNLQGFADAYATYDIIAARSRTYALSYPFIELLLGLTYFTGYNPLLVNSATLGLMAVGSIGVFQALRSKNQFQCACLGTALKLPMTKVTLVEDLTMAGMALGMILF